MLCSVSPGKSGSNWLDRLRSSRGFPAGEDLTLDHYLTNPSPIPSNSSNSILSSNTGPESNAGSPDSDENPNPVPQTKQTMEISNQNGDREWLGIMTNVISELFNMGDPNGSLTFSRKKVPRKQTNPKICLLPSSESAEIKNLNGNISVGTETAQTSNDDNLTENKVVKLKREANGESIEGEDEKGNGDLVNLGFSRSEVTIIDTSCPSWKFEKLVFRKRNVWKVRDKKGKWRNVGRKKRKGSPSNGGKVGGIGKKVKVLMLPFGASKDEGGVDCVVALNEVGQNDEKEETIKETPNIPGQVPEKRFPTPRSAKIPTKGGTSDIHMKGVREAKEIGFEATIQRRRMGKAHRGAQKQSRS